MRNLMYYARQLRQRRINAFHFSREHNPQQQLSLSLPSPQDRTYRLRRMAVDQEYDIDDEQP